MESDSNNLNLSEREIEILELLSNGNLNKEIADNLHCKTNTVRKHLQHIYTKLKVQNRTEATIKYLDITGKLKFTDR